MVINYLLKKNIFIILKITIMTFQDIAMILAGVTVLVLLGLWAMGDLKVEPFSSPPLQDRGQTSKDDMWFNNIPSSQIAVTAGGLDLANGPNNDVWWGYDTIGGPGQPTSILDGIQFKTDNPYSGGEAGHHKDHHTAKKLALEGAYSNMGVPAMGNFNQNRGAFKTKRLIRGRDWENVLLGIPGATPEERQEHLDNLFFPLMNADKITAEDRAKMYAHTPLNDPIGNASNSEFVGDSSWIYNVKLLKDKAA